MSYRGGLRVSGLRVCRVVLLVGCVVLAGCAGGAEPTSTGSEPPSTTTTTTTTVPPDVVPTLAGLTVDGTLLEPTGGGFALLGVVDPGDELVVQATVSDDGPGMLGVLDRQVPYTPAGGVAEVEVTVVVPADLAVTEVPVSLNGVSAGVIGFTPGAGWGPVITVADPTGVTGEVTLQVAVFDLNGPDTVASLTVEQEFNFQAPDHAQEVIARAGMEPAAVQELPGGVTEVRFADTRFDFRYTGDKEITEYISNNPLSPIEVTDLGSGAFEVLFSSEWPGRFPLQLTATDTDGNTTTSRTSVEVYWAEQPFEIRGIGTGVIVPGDPDYYETYIDAVSSLNINLLQINVHGWLESLTSSEIINCDFEWSAEGTDCVTGSPEDVARLAGLAHGAGLQVMLKFHAVPGEWEPTWMMSPDWDEFFSLEQGAPSYSNWVLQWAAFAEENNIEYLAIGNELNTSHNEAANWVALVAAVRGVYSGKLTYADNFWVFWYGGRDRPFPACELLDYQGLNFYYRGSGGEVGGPALQDPTIAQVRSNLSQQVEQLFTPAIQACAGLPVIITEMGMGPVDGGNIVPENWNRSLTLDHVEQAEWYTAALQVMSQYSWFQGAIPWVYQPQSRPWNSNEVVPGDIRGLPVEDALRILFESQG